MSSGAPLSTSAGSGTSLAVRRSTTGPLRKKDAPISSSHTSNTTLALAVCSAFDLGDPVAELATVSGGLSHRMWRLTTTRGCFAVKELNRKWDNPNYVAGYERAFQVELAAQAAGVRLPRPIPVPETGACLAELPSGADRPATVRVHEWVDGAGIPPGIEDAGVARAIGGVLAQIHSLGLPADQPLAEILWVRGAGRWLGLMERVKEARIAWAGRLRDALPLIAEAEAVVVAGRTDTTAVVMTHGDVNYKNVLLAEGGEPVLVDWDAAGPCGAAHEVACAALDWAGVRLHEPRPGLVRALIAGYRDAGGTFEPSGPAVLAFFLRGFLDFLEFNLRRSLGEYLQSPEDQALAQAGVPRSLDNLHRFAASADRWSRLLA